MEANKIKGEAKSLVLDNGAELTYCERGTEHEEVMICAAFYHHTFMPVIEGLAERYHVYGIVMRFDGISDQKEADGTTHWGRQWGKDVYDFAQKMGIKRFHYMGKCHGTNPGWWLVKNHPEVLIDFCSFFLAPHLKPQNSHRWADLLSGDDTTEMMRVAMRYPETGLKKKMEEVAALGPGGASSPAIFKYGSEPQQAWDSLEDCERDLKNLTVPVGYLFGSEDPLLEDYYDSNMYAWKITKGCHFTILNGECHLMELDCPERVVSEAFAFIDQAHKGY
jgi:pimeloyl-ACP methyl ester carboxylesterase